MKTPKKVIALIIGAILYIGTIFPGTVLISNAQESDEPVSNPDREMTGLSIENNVDTLYVGYDDAHHGDVAVIRVYAEYSDGSKEELTEPGFLEWQLSTTDKVGISYMSGTLFDGWNISAHGTPGSVTLTATAGGFSQSLSYTLLALPLVPDDVRHNYEISIADIPDQKYTGSEVKPAVTVTLDTKNEYNPEILTLVEGRDYTVSYGNNVETGTASVTITGINRYSGTLTKSFTITDSNELTVLEKDNPQIEDSSKGYTFRINENIENFSGVFVNGKELRKDVDYTVKSGSTIITLLPAYLETLEPNTSFDIVARFTTGSATVSIKTPEKSVTTPGEDNSNVTEENEAPTGDNTNSPTAATASTDNRQAKAARTGDTSFPAILLILLMVLSSGTAIVSRKVKQ